MSADAVYLGAGGNVIREQTAGFGSCRLIMRRIVKPMSHMGPTRESRPSRGYGPLVSWRDHPVFVSRPAHGDGAVNR